MNEHEKNKRLLQLEVGLIIFVIFVFLTIVSLSLSLSISDIYKVVLIVLSIVVLLIGTSIAVEIERITGYYECKYCKTKYVPTLGKFLISMHYGRTKYMKCSKCHQKSWSKKIL